MFHHVAHAVGQRSLFRSWEAGTVLWSILARHLPDPIAMVLMPDHVHVLTNRSAQAELREAARAFARWTTWHTGEAGPLWEPIPAAEAVLHRDKQRRTLRYVYLNPCRAFLVRCPAAWPLSTYRDSLELAASALSAAVDDAPTFHRWVSADATTNVDGTPFPGSRNRGAVDLGALAAALSEWKRVPLDCFFRDPKPRTLLLSAARSLSGLSTREIAAQVGLHPTTVLRAPGLLPGVERALGRMVADERFSGLGERDPRLSRWKPRPRG